MIYIFPGSDEEFQFTEEEIGRQENMLLMYVTALIVNILSPCVQL